MKSLMSFLIAVALTLWKLSCKGCKVVWPLCFLHSREQWLFCPCIVLVLGAVYSTILLTGQRFNSGHLAFQLVTQKCCHTKYWQVAGAYSMLFWVQRQTQSCWQRLLCTDIEAGFHLENMSRFDVPRSHSIVMLSYPWYLYTVHEGLFAVIWPIFWQVILQRAAADIGKESDRGMTCNKCPQLELNHGSCMWCEFFPIGQQVTCNRGCHPQLWWSSRWLSCSCNFKGKYFILSVCVVLWAFYSLFW